MRKYKVKYFLGAHCTGINAVYSIREKKIMNRSDYAVAAVGSYFDYEKGMYAGRITN